MYGHIYGLFLYMMRLYGGKTSLQKGSEYFSYSLCPPLTKSPVQIRVCVWSFVHRHDAYMCLLIVPKFYLPPLPKSRMKNI